MELGFWKFKHCAFRRREIEYFHCCRRLVTSSQASDGEAVLYRNRLQPLGASQSVRTTDHQGSFTTVGSAEGCSSRRSRSTDNGCSGLCVPGSSLPNYTLYSSRRCPFLLLCYPCQGCRKHLAAATWKWRKRQDQAKHVCLPSRFAG